MKFIKNKSSINNIEDLQIRNNILEIISNSDHVVSILLLTILNNQGKRNNDLTLHGYYIASCIDFMMVITKLLDDETYTKKYGATNIQKMINELISLINICLSQNIEAIQPHFTKEKILKIFHSCLLIINKKMSKILSTDVLDLDKKIKTTDIIKCYFTDIQKIKSTISKLKQVKRSSLMNFIDNKYGSICQISMKLGWLLAGSDEKNLTTIEKLGTIFALIIKLSIDFTSLEDDIYKSDGYTKNYIVNYGFQNAFELFLENKQKFIEGCIHLNIYTNTIKEIIDLIEDKIDEVIDKSSPDMKSHYTLDSV